MARPLIVVLAQITPGTAMASPLALSTPGDQIPSPVPETRQ